MKNKLLALAGAALLAFAGTTAMAVPINGSIAFTGSPTLSGGSSFQTRTTIDSVDNAHVDPNNTFGDYATATAGITNAVTVTFNTPIMFNPAALPPVPLWSFTYNGMDFSFIATSITAALEGNGQFWNIYGSGVAHIDGYDDTAGSYTITLTNSGLSVAFGSTAMASASVPDSGSTALLVGAALLGLGVIARRRGMAICGWFV